MKEIESDSSDDDIQVIFNNIQDCKKRIENAEEILRNLTVQLEKADEILGKSQNIELRGDTITIIEDSH